MLKRSVKIEDGNSWALDSEILKRELLGGGELRSRTPWTGNLQEWTRKF